MKTPEMECVLANWFDYRKNLIVPNVHWGMNMHECDLLIVSAAGYVTEVEIKVCKYDLIKDAEKTHNHDGGVARRVIKYLYFAVPEKLKEAALEYAPDRAGILIVRHNDPDDWSPRVRRVRQPVRNKVATKMSDRERYKIARLGALRIWNLKRKLLAKAS
jgi:hypothetical protein